MKKPLTVVLYLGDKKIDKLPDAYLATMSKKLGETMSTYYSTNIDEYKKI
jgi:hypothetical protein